ncbi:4'-phosphopantetheinyl transferase superfamily [Hysterangium stoloniferum]|nr:4'-phosphopantetheinyl transferase superfamily [Hysterangium stoloniferum]
MPVLGVGTDILLLPRIASIVKRRSPERFARKILCPEEYGRWHSIRTESERERFLAVRWCVKEAAYKALQPSVSLQSWKDLCFLKDPMSSSLKPLLRIVREPVPNVTLHASVSHDGDYAIAMVTAEQD